MSDSLWTPWTSLPGSPVHGISQARRLEWVAIPFSRDLPVPGIEPGSPASRQILNPPTNWGIPILSMGFMNVHIHPFVCGYSVLKRLCFSYCIILVPLSKIIWSCVFQFISGVSVPFIYMSIFMAVPYLFWLLLLWLCFEVRKSGPPVLFFSFKIVLSIQLHLWFHTNF